MGSELPPWLLPDDGFRLPALYGGLSAPGRVDRGAVVDALRSAVELATSWIGIDITWSTFMVVDGDGIRTPLSKTSRTGLDWDFISSKVGTPTWITLEGVCTALAHDPMHPNHTVAEVDAHFPLPSRGEELGRMSVALSVQRWAMYGSGENMPWIAGPLVPWLVTSAERLGAHEGYAILDRVRGSETSSAAEHRGVFRNHDGHLWGYGWSTLLSPSHLERVGGVEQLAELPDAQVVNLSGGRVWLTLGDDPSAVPDATMWRLHEILTPVLPPPYEPDESEVDLDPPLPATVEAVRAAWEAKAEAARAGGRVSGMFGPVGFTLDAKVPEAVMPVAVGPGGDLVQFEGLGAQAAASLLNRLTAPVLDARLGPGPTLRTALRAAVAHPGVVLLKGHAVGPGREDERVTVDGMDIQDDPVLRRLGQRQASKAWQRVLALGLDDALDRPDELRAPAENGGPWSVWWD
ncbi:hypothetical protein [Cellulomonas sp. URHE0023]|uniref:hypothetical protein n=1 Tax=Cellulomonas sp. URHE0023 TaxID=1380354 RepID=UPI00068B6DA6|nr:hypothetical protein [Cellulomonas sp. URHE0023]